MATLPSLDRGKISSGLQRHFSALREPIALIKSDLRAAVDATDDWIDLNQASYNAALPLAARNNLTASQKTLLFCAVAAYRVSKSFAIKLLGEVD